MTFVIILKYEILFIIYGTYSKLRARHLDKRAQESSILEGITSKSILLKQGA